MKKIDQEYLDKIYNKFKEEVITFTQRSTKKLGLVQDSVVVNIGTVKFKCAVISISMVEMQVIAKIEENAKKVMMNRKNIASIELKFRDELYKESTIYKLYGKVSDLNPYNGYDDIFTIDINMVRRIPEGLILKFKEFFQLKSSEDEVNPLECLLFVNGARKRCKPVDLSKNYISFELDTINHERFVNKRAIAVIKHVVSGDVIEISGITDLRYLKFDDLLRIKMNFSYNDQSPRFDYAFSSLIKYFPGNRVTTGITYSAG